MLLHTHTHNASTAIIWVIVHGTQISTMPAPVTMPRRSSISFKWLAAEQNTICGPFVVESKRFGLKQAVEFDLDIRLAQSNTPSVFDKSSESRPALDLTTWSRIHPNSYTSFHLGYPTRQQTLEMAVRSFSSHFM